MNETNNSTTEGVAMNEYTIKRQRLDGDGYETMIIHNPATGEEIAEYRLTPGRERSEIAAMRRAIDRHLRQANTTIRNYQW